MSVAAGHGTTLHNMSGSDEGDITVLGRATLNFASATPRNGPRPVEVTVHDGRAAVLPGWDVCGFELVAHPSAVSEWSDEQIVGVHHAEMEQLARSMTGCDHALVTSHIKRGPDQAARHEDLAPIMFVHSDFAPGYDDLIRRMYREGGGGDSARAALERNGLTAADVQRSRRMVILQFWRNIGPAKMDFPIAFCDARSIAYDDGRAFLVHDYAGSGVDFEALAIMAPSESSPQRWYAFPELRPDEVVAFRTYDSDLVAEATTYFTPHSAFRDAEVEIGRPARQSIELRANCLYF